MALERRRLREEERRDRILNAKVRTMGIDTAALEEQMRDKEVYNTVEKLRDEHFDEQRLQQAKLAQSLEQEKLDRRKQKLVEVDEYRKHYQTYDSRREFDLNDPNALKKDAPARVSDDDVRCGVSSLQKFHGEDLTMKDRVNAQRGQMNQWISEQLAEKRAKEQLDNEEELMWQQRQEEINFLAEDLERKRQQLRALKIQHEKEYNLEQARSKQEEEEMQRIRDEEARLQEIENMLNNDFLNENFATTISAVDSTRFIPYNFKQMRPDQYNDIMEERYNQIIEKKRLLDEEMEREQLWQLQEKLTLRQATLMDRERERLRKEKLKELQNTQKQQTMEFKEKTQRINEIYENRVTEDFFSQFQKSSR